MEILETAQETLFFPSCGKQHDGTKESKPVWTMPKASRDTEKKVFISNKHQQDLLGRDSPGFAYEPKRQKDLPKWGFGTSVARPMLSKPQYPDSSIDIIGKTPDALRYKYKTTSAMISTCPRNAEANSPDFEGFTCGKISPGPQRYKVQSCPPCVRLGHAPGIDKIAPKYTMRPYTKILEHQSQTGPKVGPGVYPKQSACDEQADSTKPTLPQWKINRRDRFEEKKKHDSYRLWDGHGTKKEQYNRTFSVAPSFSFGTSKRAQAQKVAPMHTPLDKGPVATMAKPSMSTPSLPSRREVLRYSDVHG
mmetsp:Transcript_77093/g.216311  ORF Transcript_77093/g.216311 Transcript_77093/m.216311 type:complete len:306 (-) Transcript_77093:143-1060(-)